jgi:spore germination cell wall hydrolase CwlJ-like protein
MTALLAAALALQPTPSREAQIDVVAAVICAEARGEGWPGMCAIAQSIRHRGGSAYLRVIEPGQFQCITGTTPTALVAKMRREGGWDDARVLAKWLVVGAPKPFPGDPVNGATHFHDTSIPTPKGWGPCLAVVGKIKFYKPNPTP